MNIGQATKWQTNSGNGNWMGPLLGALLVFWSAQLFAREDTATPGKPEVREQINPQRVLVLSIPDRKLAVTEGNRVLKVYDVAVGKPSTPSPTGELKIINKLVDPTYHHQGKVVPPGKSNPLGNRWMGLSAKGYGIHGTNAQSSVGKAASHGCIRMRKHDVEELFTMVGVGDVVVIHGERDRQVAEIFAGPAVVAGLSPAPSVPRAPEPSLAALAAMAEGF
jgi:hypothetical protein